MDLVSSCKDKLAYFRIKELKDVLSQLGLAKQGKKQDLVDRILAVLSDDQAITRESGSYFESINDKAAFISSFIEHLHFLQQVLHTRSFLREVSKVHGWARKNSVGKEGVAKIIDDIYRKLQVPGATDLASKGQSGSDLNNVKLKEEVDDSFQLDMKIRCPCGSSLATESMIQCEDPRCHVWQHIACVIIPEKPMEGLPPVPLQFYCEICRLSRADPFWVTLVHPLFPVKLSIANAPPDGTNPVQNVERSFQLTRADRDMLLKQDHDVQAWCMLLNDKVPFRVQWPQYSDLQVNGIPVRTTNRPGSQLLGANGRDDGPVIKTFTREGLNKISLQGCDARIFCIGIRIVKQRTIQQVLNMIPKETEGERFEDALARVCRCIGGGNTTENADSDSDLEVVADSVTVNLRCPMSGSRIKTAGRFKPCAHMGCFDLETFVELNQRSRKWQCPICLKNYSLENIIIDPYFNRITTMMLHCSEDVTEIDVKPDGSWRAKNENEHGDLAQWHFPDGSLSVTLNNDAKLNLEASKRIKQEGVSEEHTGLKLGIRKNSNGFWEFSKAEDVHCPSSGNCLPEKVIPMSSSATGSCRDGEDPSVNQDGGGHFDFSVNNGNELDSLSLNFDPYRVGNRSSSGPVVDANVIVLSDSEEENEKFPSNEAVYQNCQSVATGIPYPVAPTEVPDSYQEDQGGNSCLFFSGNNDDFGMPLWQLPSGTQAGPGFQLFGTDTDVSDALVGMPNTSASCPTSMNGYTLTPDMPLGSSTQVPDPSACHSNTDINDGLVDNPLAFGGDDPSLQIFLPTQPASVSAQSDTRDQPDLANGIRAEDWISLRLGGSGGGSRGHGESGATNGLNSRNQLASKEGRMEALANTASLLLSMNGSRPDRITTNKQRSDGPFSHPRQPRSVRPRLDLCIDLDSD